MVHNILKYMLTVHSLVSVDIVPALVMIQYLKLSNALWT